MTTLVANVLQQYDKLIQEDKYADFRTKDLPLIGRPITILIILGCYLFFCMRAGPWFMKHRKPYKLTTVLIIYNSIQVLLSCYMAFGGSYIYLTQYNLLCQPLHTPDMPYSDEMTLLSYTYFIAKITELLDTVFFVLRKKYNQVSTLHLVHHSIMPATTWFGVRYFLGGQGMFFGILNSYVHIVMYAYYLIAGLGPEYQKYVWWKKHVTLIQLVQFVLLFLHSLYAVVTPCTYPKAVLSLHLSYSIFFMYMFGKFYIKSYVKKPEQKAK